MAPDCSKATIRVHSGNKAYAEGCADYLDPALRSERLLQASEFYRQAFDASTSEEKRAKCSAYLAAAHWTHAKLFLELFPEGKGSPLPERPPTIDIELSIRYYIAVLRHGKGSKQSAAWRRTMSKKMEEMSRFIVDQGKWILSSAEFLFNVNELFGAEVSSDGKCQAWAILLFGFAQNRFGRAAEELKLRDANGSRKQNYGKCLSLLYSCSGPIKEAEQRARGSELLEEIYALKASVDDCRATCESIQATVEGQKLLAEALGSENKVFRFDVGLCALGKFKDAAYIAREVDVECEAEAMVRLGDVYRKLFKNDNEAHRYYSDAVQLAQSSDALLFNWYRKAKLAVDKFSKKAQEHARGDGNGNDDAGDSEVPRPIEKEVDELETAFKKLNTKEFLRYVYKQYPPRGKSKGGYRLGPLNTEAATRQALRRALQHYHPDHNYHANHNNAAAEDESRWIELCGEITTLLLIKLNV